MTTYEIKVNSKQEYNRHPISLTISLAGEHEYSDILHAAETKLYEQAWSEASMPDICPFELSDLYDEYRTSSDCDNGIEFKYNWNEDLVNWGCNLGNACYDEKFEILHIEKIEESKK